MNAIVGLPTAPLGMAHLAPPARPPIEAILAASGPAFMGVFAPFGERPDPTALRDGIAGAEAFLESCAVHAEPLRDAVELLPVDEIGKQVGIFVTAWPNASRADLAGYGAQLAEDVIERRPCRYALRSALHHLRQTANFLPAIAEVLVELDAAQSRMAANSPALSTRPNPARARSSPRPRRAARPAPSGPGRTRRTGRKRRSGTRSSASSRTCPFSATSRPAPGSRVPGG